MLRQGEITLVAYVRMTHLAHCGAGDGTSTVRLATVRRGVLSPWRCWIPDNTASGVYVVVHLYFTLAKTQARANGKGQAKKAKLEAAIGFEPMNRGFAVRCLTTWLRRRD